MYIYVTMNVGILVLPLYVLAFSTGVPFPSYFFDFFLSFAVIVSFTYEESLRWYLHTVTGLKVDLRQIKPHHYGFVN